MIREKVNTRLPAANRTNSRKTPGPKIRRGKLISSLDALGYGKQGKQGLILRPHGLRMKFFVRNEAVMYKKKSNISIFSCITKP
jgi:hypothetical protein